MKKLQLKKFVRSHKKATALVGGGFLVIVGAIGFFYFSSDSADNQPEPPQRHYSMLTGQEVSEDISRRPVVAVMVENSQFARPQTGLDNAGFIFETVTEGGITRFMALYQEDQPDIIGPVRSLRPAFVNWLMGFDAAVAHVGGSARALQLVNQRNAKSLNEFTNSGPYYRSDDRSAPHNMYVRMDDLRQLMSDKEYEQSQFADIPRSEDAVSADASVKKVSVAFSTPEFNTSYTYSPSSNTYTRSLAGSPHIDRATDKPITVKNVVVIRISNNLTGIGSGKAWLFKDGGVQEIRWTQTDHTERMQFVDETGNQVALNRGDTWVAAITGNGSVSYKEEQPKVNN